MKTVNVTVNNTEDIIYYNDRPYRLENMSFHRDDSHNCQMVVYATMKPLIAELNKDVVQLQADVDDMIEQFNPDAFKCDYCKSFIDGNDPDVVILSDCIYCDVSCEAMDGQFCDICDSSLPCDCTDTEALYSN